MNTHKQRGIDMSVQYRGIDLVDIPSGMGGVLPAAVAQRHDDGTMQVICLHDEFYPNWLLTVKQTDTKPFSYSISDRIKKILDKRITRGTP